MQDNCETDDDGAVDGDGSNDDDDDVGDDPNSDVVDSADPTLSTNVTTAEKKQKRITAFSSAFDMFIPLSCMHYVPAVQSTSVGDFRAYTRRPCSGQPKYCLKLLLIYWCNWAKREYSLLNGLNDTCRSQGYEVMHSKKTKKTEKERLKNKMQLTADM